MEERPQSPARCCDRSVSGIVHDSEEAVGPCLACPPGVTALLSFSSSQKAEDRCSLASRQHIRDNGQPSAECRRPLKEESCSIVPTRAAVSVY